MTATPRSRRGLLQGAAGIVTTGAILLYLWHRRAELVQLVAVPADQVVLVALLFAIGHWLNSLEFWLLYRRLRTPIGATENWLLFTAGQLLNHVPGRVGTLYRLEYLRSVHAVSYARSASVYATDLVITALACGALGLTGTSLVGGWHDRAGLPVLATFAVLLVAATAALFVRLPFARGDGRLARTWESFRSGWREITAAPGAAAAVAALEAAKYLLAAWRMQIAFSWIGLEAKLPFFLVLAAVTGVVTFLAFTPAAMGLRELAIGAAAALLGADLDQSLLGATLERAVLLVLTGLLGGIGLLYTAHRLSLARGARALADPAD